MMNYEDIAIICHPRYPVQQSISLPTWEAGSGGERARGAGGRLAETGKISPAKCFNMFQLRDTWVEVVNNTILLNNKTWIICGLHIDYMGDMERYISFTRHKLYITDYITIYHRCVFPCFCPGRMDRRNIPWHREVPGRHQRWIAIDAMAVLYCWVEQHCLHL